MCLLSATLFTFKPHKNSIYKTHVIDGEPEIQNDLSQLTMAIQLVSGEEGTWTEGLTPELKPVSLIYSASSTVPSPVDSYHHVLATENNPEGEKHCIEDTLSDITKQQHPGPVKPNGKPFHWDIDKSHGNSKGKDDSDGEKISGKQLYSFGRQIFKNQKPVLGTEMSFIMAEVIRLVSYPS